jgi:hypothetical protein
MLQTVSKFDFIERNKGFFKYQQENMHKSNIYSIKLINTRLNPENDKKLIYYYSEYDLQTYLIKNQTKFEINNEQYTINRFSLDLCICLNKDL